MSSLYSVGTSLGLIGIVALAVIAVVLSRRQAGQPDRSADSLWDELRKAHGLSRTDARILKEAADGASLDPQALIFVEPHLLKQAADAAAARGAPAAGRAPDLHRRLFS